ncbi:MAG: FAD-linked oxidase C-terminal domain-containing protein, partial [Hyphomicrobium sp.]
YALLEISSNDSGGRADAQLHALLMNASDAGLIRDGALAASMQQARDFWGLRESFSEAQKGAGGSIKHDISVPIARIPEFLERAAAVVEKVCPGARPVPFGHFGDGNLHYNISQPEGMEKAQYLGLWGAMSDAIHTLVTSMDGSISAEHGIGQMKRDHLVRYKSPVEIEMMRAIKNAFDPKGILNPNKLLERRRPET